jgi:hypothetical protein
MRMTRNWLGVSGVTFCLLAVSQPGTIAGTLHNQWNYAIDSFTDGVADDRVGGTRFEIYGIAFQETGDRVQVAVNTNIPLAGVAETSAQNGTVALGDLFFNFSGKPFNAANGELYAVRFIPANDSSVGLGLFGNVVAKSVTDANDGFSRLEIYNDVVLTGGGTPALGDLSATTDYFAQDQPVLNAIDSGTFLADLQALDPTGLDFAHFGAIGSQTLGFSVDRSKLPAGDFIASLFAECANDGVAIQQSLQSDAASTVPEPSNLLGLGLAAIALVLGTARIHKTVT